VPLNSAATLSSGVSSTLFAASDTVTLLFNESLEITCDAEYQHHARRVHCQRSVVIGCNDEGTLEYLGDAAVLGTGRHCEKYPP
jgi:hypothetical protein